MNKKLIGESQNKNFDISQVKSTMN